MSAVAIVLFTLGMVLIYHTLDTVFLYERRCYCVVDLGYGIELPWIRCSYMSAVAKVLFTLVMVLIYLRYGVPV